MKFNQEMYKWLQQDAKNVVVVHCMSGKGRTGVAIKTLLLYTGFYTNIQDCARHFGICRFQDEIGIDQPCHLRFIHFFEAFYKRKIKSP